MSPGMKISLAALLACACLLGLVWGQRAIPPDETEIIAGVAAQYVAETGGAPTDCFARPSALEGVRMVVICENDRDAPWARAVDTYGATVDIGPDLLAEELRT
jgi:hypothetical protein